MPTNIGLSRYVEGSEYVRLLKWLKRENSPISAGETLALVSEGAKQIVEITAERSGTLKRILVQEGPDELLGREIIGVISSPGDDSEKISECIATAQYINELLDGLALADDGDNGEEEDFSDGEDYEDEQMEDDDQEVQIEQPIQRPQRGRPESFLANLFGAAVGSVSSRSTAGNNQPRIGNVIERGHGVFEVYDDDGNRTAQISFHGAELKGFTSTQFHLRSGGRLYSFNVRGQRLGDRTV